MQSLSLFDLFSKALTYLAGLKSHAQTLTDSLASANLLISDLKSKLDGENTVHSALVDRANRAEARVASLEASAAHLDTQASALADAINEHPEAPTVDPATLAVVDPNPGVLPAASPPSDSGFSVPPGTGWAAPDAPSPTPATEPAPTPAPAPAAQTFASVPPPPDAAPGL